MSDLPDLAPAPVEDTMLHASVVWLVDMGYVVKASDGKFRLDYFKAERMISHAFGPIATYLFNGVDAAYGISERLQAFYNAMQYHGIYVRLQPMQAVPGGQNRQRRVDVDFSAHMVWQASLPYVTTLVLTTGDQDFVPAVELVRGAFGKRVVLFTYDTMVHHDLVAAADECWLFEQYVDHLIRW